MKRITDSYTTKQNPQLEDWTIDGYNMNKTVKSASIYSAPRESTVQKKNGKQAIQGI